MVKESSIMARAKAALDEEREERIHQEIIPDCYDAEERVTGWYTYLEETISGFSARCIAYRPISPLRVGDEVEVLGMADADECNHEMFVRLRWDRKEGLAVPLSQLEPIKGDSTKTTRAAVADWHYWVRRGYEF